MRALLIIGWIVVIASSLYAQHTTQKTNWKMDFKSFSLHNQHENWSLYNFQQPINKKFSLKYDNIDAAYWQPDGLMLTEVPVQNKNLEVWLLKSMPGYGRFGLPVYERIPDNN